MLYGYKMQNGEIMIDEQQAQKIRLFFDAYNSGCSLNEAAKNSGINKTHSVLGRMLRNRHYLGSTLYPQIIDEDTFNLAEITRQKRASALGRIKEPIPKAKPVVSYDFIINTSKTKVSKDPYEQAEYIYSTIERKVSANG